MKAMFFFAFVRQILELQTHSPALSQHSHRRLNIVVHFLLIDFSLKFFFCFIWPPLSLHTHANTPAEVTHDMILSALILNHKSLEVPLSILTHAHTRSHTQKKASTPEKQERT